MARLRQLLALVIEYPFFTVCLLLALTAAGFIVAYRRQLPELELTHDRVRQEGESILKTIAAAGTLRADRDAIETAVRDIDGNLVTEENLAGNLGYFYQIEEQTHARIADMHQNPAATTLAGARYKTVPLAVSVTGTYAQVAAFVRSVETGPRLMRVTAFSYRRAQAGGDSVVLDLSLDMLAHP